jgi:hypothetical protein
VSDRWRTLNVGAPGCNTKCVSRQVEHINVGALSCNTFVLERWSTLNVGTLGYNTTCVLDRSRTF